jgi:hypothetical protein
MNEIHFLSCSNVTVGSVAAPALGPSHIVLRSAVRIVDLSK